MIKFNLVRLIISVSKIEKQPNNNKLIPTTIEGIASTKNV